jgi:uncharacterized protein YndB with AHSA1/START domain
MNIRNTDTNMHTTTEKPAEQPFVISRLFNAPRGRVWKAWSECEQLRQWFGPAGFTTSHATLDLRPGGSFHYCMRTPDGKELWGRFIYREVVAPEKIVWVNSFSDAAGGITRHPFSPTWPLELLSTAQFADEGGKTRFTLEWSPLNPTIEERKTFNSGHDSMRQGWSGTLGRLESHLAKG